MADGAASQKGNISEHLQSVLDGFVKFKNEYLNNKDECTKLLEANNRLEVEVQELRELEKTHRYHLSTSREIISNLQDSVSNLISFKRDTKKFITDIQNRDKTIDSMKEEKANMEKIHEESVQALIKKYEQESSEIHQEYEAKIRRSEQEHDTQATLYTCEIAELNSKIAEMKVEHEEKMNLVVLDYEERLQRAAAQATQLRDQHAGLMARTDANIDVYRRRIEELEEKLKLNRCNQFIAQNSVMSQAHSPYRPLPASYADSEVIDMDTQFYKPKPSGTQGKSNIRGLNQLPLVQIPGPKQEKKGFNVVKKRKLYTDKEFK